MIKSVIAPSARPPLAPATGNIATPGEPAAADRAHPPLAHGGRAAPVPRIDTSSRLPLLASLVGVCIAGYVMVLAGTGWGTGLTNDSAMYIGGARQLAAGQGYSWPRFTDDGSYFQEPIYWWPPMFSTVLGGVTALGADPLSVARHLNAALLGLNAILAGLIVWHATRYVRLVREMGTSGTVYAASQRSPWPALFAATASVLMLDFVSTYSYAWSEPLFILFVLLSLWAVAGDIERPRWGLLILAAVAAGASYLTRYAGYCVIGSGALAILLLGSGHLGRRLIRATVFCGISGLAVVTWMARNWYMDVPSGGRPLSPDPDWYVKLENLWDVMRHWFLPATVKDEEWGEPALPWVLFAASAVMAAAWWWMRRHWRSTPWPWQDTGTDQASARPTALLGVFFIFVCCYTVFVTATLALFDRAVNFDQRMCSPLLAGVVICVAIFFSRALHDLRARDFRRPAARMGVAVFGWVIVSVAFVLLGNNLYATLDHIAFTRERGQGFHSANWHKSTGLDFVRSLPPKAMIYSNGERPLVMFTGRPSARLPKWTYLKEEDLSTLQMLRTTLEERGGAVLYFHNVPLRDGTMTPERLAEELDLTLIPPGRHGDATILVIGD